MCSESFTCLFANSRSVTSCAFFSGVASVWHLSHKAEICELLQRLLSFWQVLPSQLRNCVVVRVVIGFLVTSLTKVLLAPLLILVKLSAVATVWVIPCSFHFPNDQAHCALGNFPLEKSFYTLPQIYASSQFYLGALQTVPWTSWWSFSTMKN